MSYFFRKMIWKCVDLWHWKSNPIFFSLSAFIPANSMQGWKFRNGRDLRSYAFDILIDWTGWACKTKEDTCYCDRASGDACVQLQSSQDLVRKELHNIQLHSTCNDYISTTCPNLLIAQRWFANQQFISQLCYWAIELQPPARIPLAPDRASPV